MSSLSDFYGMSASSSAEDAMSVPSSETQDVSSGLPSSTSFSSSSPSSSPASVAALPSDPTLLDSANFDAQAYLNRLLSRKGMSELIQHDNDMMADRRALDSSMQTLVYDNYNKFISATDMIRQMKQNVESMEQEMNHLLTNMTQIEGNVQTMHTAWTPHGQQLDKVVAVNKLLKRLEFLFELPGRLKRSIQYGAYEQAVKYYRVSSSILKAYVHIKSFHLIKQESEEIMQALKTTLRNIIQQKQQAAQQQQQQQQHSNNIDDESQTEPEAGSAQAAQTKKALNSENHMSLAVMLMDLNEPPEPLLNDILNKKKTKLTADMNKVVDMQAKLLKTSSAAATNIELFHALHDVFLSPYLLFSHSYLATFIQPYENKRTSKAKLQCVDTCKEALKAFTLDMWQQYFQVARKELFRKANIQMLYQTMQKQENAPQQLANQTSFKLFDVNTASELIFSFLESLKFFYSSVNQCQSIVSLPALLNRAMELLEHAIRHAVESVCQLIREYMQLLFIHTKENIAQWKNDLHQAGQTWMNEMKERYQQNKNDQIAHFIPPNSFLPSVSSLSSYIRSIIEHALRLIRQVLSPHPFLPESLTQSFHELAHSYVHQLLHSINEGYLKVVDRQVQLSGYVWTPAQQANITQLNQTNDSNAVDGLFCLLLCQVCRQLQSSDLPPLIDRLNMDFPVARNQHVTQLQRKQAVLEELEETAQVLLQKYVEVNGIYLTSLIRKYFGRNTNTSSALTPSTWISDTTWLLFSMECELSRVFSKNDGVDRPSHGESARFSARGANHSSSASSLSNHTRLRSTGADRENTINRDIQRLFTQRVQTFGVVKYSHLDPLLSVLKIAIKAMVELVRLERMTTPKMSQLQFDIYTLRRDISRCLVMDQEEHKMILLMLDEVVHSAHERTNKSSFSVTDIPESKLRQLYESHPSSRTCLYDVVTATRYMQSDDSNDQWKQSLVQQQKVNDKSKQNKSSEKRKVSDEDSHVEDQTADIHSNSNDTLGEESDEDEQQLDDWYQMKGKTVRKDSE